MDDYEMAGKRHEKRRGRKGIDDPFVKPFRYYRYISPVSPADILTEKNHARILPLMDKKVRTLQI
ncbi:hypothetical protein [Bacillus licheniformis]|uniref:hypothetical protein n=1 Tax=Bacillus licheniformis TaxID=1402 RepID=UPI002281DA21|nr:hypothetical protein [Bacillus licheniformis]MCY8023220.1 hypothetical protein [Bacillus licheniformis]